MILWNRIKLKSANPKARLHAVQSLGSSGKEKAVKPLLRSLSDPDARVRSAAAKALGHLQSERALQLLLPCLADKRSEVRKAAVISLRYQGDGRASRALAPLLKDPDVQVRAATASTLRKLDWHPANEEERAAFEVASGHVLSATFSGRAAIAPLVQTLKHQASDVRRSVAAALEFIDDPRALQPLLDTVKDPDPTVRVSAIHALGKAASHPAVNALLQSLAKDPDNRVRLAAIQVLVKGHRAPPLHLFLELLQDPYFEIRQIVAQCLGKSGIVSLASALIPLLSDSDNDVRHTAAGALGSLSAPIAIEALVLALGDEESAVRQAARTALDKIDPHWIRDSAARAAAPKLSQVLRTRPDWVRGSVSPLLAKLCTAQPHDSHDTDPTSTAAAAPASGKVIPLPLIEHDREGDSPEALTRS